MLLDHFFGIIKHHSTTCRSFSYN